MAKKKIRTFKEIRADIEALPAITSKANFSAAIPLLIEMNEKITTMRSTIKKCSALVNDLNEACSGYALDHNSIFVNGLVTDGKGVQHGDVEIDGVVYHFASGFGKMIRVDGDNLTQSFLSGLPTEWVKTKFELDTTGISRLNISEDALEKKGLVRRANYSWTRPETFEAEATE